MSSNASTGSNDTNDSYLLLEDGSIFLGKRFGADVSIDGEIGKSMYKCEHVYYYESEPYEGTCILFLGPTSSNRKALGCYFICTFLYNKRVQNREILGSLYPNQQAWKICRATKTHKWNITLMHKNIIKWDTLWFTTSYRSVNIFFTYCEWYYCYFV